MVAERTVFVGDSTRTNPAGFAQLKDALTPHGYTVIAVPVPGALHLKTAATSDQYAAPIATQVEPAATFYPAETYHQDYVARTGRACHIADPWINTKQIDHSD